MDSRDTHGQARRRKDQRLGLLRRRAALASGLGFAAFLALAGQHAVGSAKHTATKAATPVSAAAPTRYFDDQASGFAFANPSEAPLAPPVAQTHVS